MKRILAAALVTAALVLHGCGERPADPNTDSSDSASGSNPDGEAPSLGAATPNEALSVHAISDRNSVPTGGNDVATITALITDDSNRAVSEQAIEFSSTGGVLQNITAVTDTNGEASAVLALARDFRNQDITVSVESGGATGSVVVSAVGSSIDVAGPSALVTMPI